MAAEKKSNFSLACNLLSKLVKKGSFNELGLELSPRPQEQQTLGQGHEPRQPTTMNLLPGLVASDAAIREGTGTGDCVVVSGESTDLFPRHKEDANTEEEHQTGAQLTIFYGGKVLVFDNFPSEKVMGLMKFASEGNSGGVGVGVGVAMLEPDQPYTPPADLAMPIARRASIHRFCAKRKDRSVSKAPYDLKKAWLGQRSL